MMELSLTGAVLMSLGLLSSATSPALGLSLFWFGFLMLLSSVF